MRRSQLIEFHDSEWFPLSLRDAVTSTLQHVLNSTRYYELAAPILASGMRATESDRVIDLCSGGGGPWQKLIRLIGESEPVSVLLTDKFPNLACFDSNQSHGDNGVDYFPQSVDAEAIPSSFCGFRTFFNCFHHFPPDRARRILCSAAAQGEGIAIFEVPERSWRGICSTILMPLGAIALLPSACPFRLSTLFWTYMIPVIPFVMWFDGLVSCLRAYAPDELRAMAPAVSAYTWKSGTLRDRFSPVSVTYLIGYAEKPPS